MQIPDLYAKAEPTVSFEFFPPKSPEAEDELFEKTVPGLQSLGASFFSVTYGAGGSTRDATLRLVSRIRDHYHVEALAHLTCVGSTPDNIGGFLDEARGRGVENILALRGDPPKGQTEFKPVAGGFSYAVDLIKYIRARADFAIGAACYPEGHQECSGKLKDWDYAADKVEAGADFLITQLFYDWEDFLAMEDYLRNKRGVKVPIVPGVLPFLSAKQIKRFTSLCGSKLPGPLLKKLDEYESDDEAVTQIGVDVCTEICAKALAHGVKGIHFYCLNRIPSCQKIVNNLRLVR